MHFRPFPVFWAYVFLSGKSADPTPPLLVENSTNFFETFPKAPNSVEFEELRNFWAMGRFRPTGDDRVKDIYFTWNI